MNDRTEPTLPIDPDAPTAAGGDAPRLRVSGIVEAPGGGALENEDAPEGALRAASWENPRRRRGWNAASRQMWLCARLSALFLFCAVVIGWPLGDALAYREINDGLGGWSFYESLSLEVFLLVVIVPTLILLIGYIMSRQMQMMGAAESIAAAARQFVTPDVAAAEGARSVGAVVREQVDALNTGLDGALRRLAAVEAMIRQHVDAIETAGASMESSAAGAVQRVADERARLIDLTEHLNAQADAFAAAIAAKAQASIEALHTADDVAARAQANLEERLARLDAAAQTAYQSFNALCEALQGADERFRAAAGAVDSSAAQTRTAIEKATSVSAEAADAAARSAETVTASTARLAEEARKAAESALETMRRATHETVEAASAEAARANAAAAEVSQAARRAAEAAAKASGDFARASSEARANAESAETAQAEAAARIEARNRALAEAREALERENARLEALIEEQRKRADRLADAIATQTERLARLAEARRREEKTRAQKEAPTPAAAEAAAEAQSAPAHGSAPRATPQPPEVPVSQSAQTTPAEKSAGDEAAERKPAPGKIASDEPLDLKDAARADAGSENAGKNGRKFEAFAEDLAERRKNGRREPPVPAKSRSSAQGRSAQADREASRPRRRKQEVSWREILDATDEADPLDLAAVSVTPPTPSSEPADGPAPIGAEADSADAIRIVSRLQAFTFELETRLYGEPPAPLRERFERGDRNVFANRLLRLNEADVKRRIRAEAARDKGFERDVHAFLQGFERLLEDATASETADEDLEEYLSSPLGRVYLLIGATVGYFA
ncbi:hypothetical protein [Amphiplicatus metriothermophilus]|nr:hypothetical protein [Amphiplicatus metriothermophilus]MBB5518905.1 hypothetical protein [Amphiplicatus metriothermophilus]